jgi:hypothetical protein
MMKALWLLPVAFVVAACSYPTTRVDTVDDRAQLQFANAPKEAIVIVDGNAVGPAARFDGSEATLAVARGTHHVEVRDGGRTLYSQDLYLGGDMTKTITLQE